MGPEDLFKLRNARYVTTTTNEPPKRSRIAEAWRSFTYSGIYGFITEVLLPILLVIAAFLALVWFLAWATSGETRTVPKDSCTSTATGRVNTVITQQCVGYNKDGACTNWMPVVTEYKEVVTTCTFKEWR